MSILNSILEHKKEELKGVMSAVPLPELKAMIRDLGRPIPFQSAVSRKPGSQVNLIAELKKASPSKGLIRENFNLTDIVSVYDRKDVSAISVLTEERFFSGKLSYLNQARKKTDKPLLRKDFIFSEYQVYESKANNADAILLITAALEKSQLNDLYYLAKELSLDCLVEVHNWQELDTALYCGSEIIGINNRDLKTLNISLNVTFALMKDIPDDVTVVSESGINKRGDIEALNATRADAVLIGTSIMKEKDMEAKIDELMGAKPADKITGY